MSQRKPIACLAVVGALVLLFLTPLILRNISILIRYSQVAPQLEHLPNPEESPGDTVAAIEVGSLILNASASFTGGTPHQGPESFGFTLVVNASSIGEYDISDFQVVKVTAFRLDLTPVYSFDMTTSQNMTIISGTYELLIYEEDWLVPRGTISYGMFFLRILVTFDTNLEAILTTPPSPGQFWIE